MVSMIAKPSTNTFTKDSSNSLKSYSSQDMTSTSTDTSGLWGPKTTQEFLPQANLRLRLGWLTIFLL